MADISKSTLRLGSDMPRLMTVDADKADAHVAIVRELAERGPLLNDDSWCASCDYDPHEYGYDFEKINDPANHEPSCLWRRARELYPPT